MERTIMITLTDVTESIATMVDMTAIVALTVYVFSKIHPVRNWLLMVYDGWFTLKSKNAASKFFCV